MSTSVATVVSPDLAINASVPIRSVELAPQLELETKSYVSPVYKFSRFTQVSGGTTQNLTRSTTLSTFNIPGSEVYNFSRSFLAFDVTVGVQAALAVLWTDNIPLQYIQLQTNSGQVIAQLNNVQPYSKTIRFAQTKMLDYLSKAPVKAASTIDNSLQTTNFCCQPAEWIPSDSELVAGEMSSQYMVDVKAQTTAVAVVPSATGDAASGVDKVSLAPQTMAAGTSATAVTMHYKIPLSAFKGTLLALDKDLYFGQNMQLLLNWQPSANWGFNSVVAATNATATDFAADTLSLANYYLWMCKDINQENVANIKAQVNSSGMGIMVPYTNCDMRTAAIGDTNYTYSTIISPGSGVVLKRIATVMVNGNDTLTSSSLCNNVGQVKFTALQSFLDSKPIQDQKLVDADGDIWNYMYPIIKDSPVGLSNRIYRIRQFFVDNFSDCDNAVQWDENDMKESGLALGNMQRLYEIRYDRSATTVGSKIYQYQTYLRKLIITPQGITWGM